MKMQQYFLRRQFIQIFGLLCFALMLTSCGVSNPLEPFEKSEPLDSLAISVGFTRHFGTTNNDKLTGITSDTLGNIYIAGNNENSSGKQAFIRKYDSAGTFLWHKNKALASIDGITLDKNGNVYAVGSYVNGVWPNARDSIYLEKYDSAGNSLWTKQFTVPIASDPTYLFANAIATDPRGNNYIVILFEKAYYPYQTRQVFARKYTVSGGLVWETFVANSSPYTTRPSLTTDTQGNVYTATNTVANQRWNTNLAKLDVQGNNVWSTPLSATHFSWLNYVNAIAADKTGNVYVAGITRGNLGGTNLGSDDAFVRKYDSGGNPLWTRQFGTSSSDYANSLAIDESGIYIAGSSMGSLRGINRGSYDAFVRKYDSSGNNLITNQFGTSEFDIASAIQVDANGYLYVGGDTYGSLGGRARGGSDVYFRKYTVFE